MISRHTPLGVVGAIVPWNFPILLAVWKIAPALVAGNTIIVKPSPFTPLCDLKLVDLVQDLLPPGVFSAVSGDDELGKWMTAHPGIAKIAFTGSTDTGKHVMRAAAGTLKRVTLELGGNDPAIVLPDVDPAKIAPQIFWAVLQNNAQFCNAAKRVYIHDDVYDAVRDELVEYARTVVVGNGADAETQLGPIQNLAQLQKVQEYFDDCAAHGYTFALGGQIDPTTRGWFVRSPSSTIRRRIPGWSSRSRSVPSFRCCAGRRKTPSLPGRTPPSGVWARPSGAKTSKRSSGSAAGSKPGRCGSTRCTSTPRIRSSADTSSPASAPRTRCTDSPNTPTTRPSR